LELFSSYSSNVTLQLLRSCNPNMQVSNKWSGYLFDQLIISGLLESFVESNGK